MNLTEEQLVQNWNDLRLKIDKTFDGDRKVKLLEMYDGLADRMMMAPAWYRTLSQLFYWRIC